MEKKMAEKKIIAVSGSKGGCGKSALTFMLAEKYKNSVVLDLDDATQTSLKQLAYRNPIMVSFLDPITQRIDRSAFNTLFESVAEANRDLFIADLGASVAEQLPKYFEANGAETIRVILASHSIQLQIACVIGGGNNFKATMNYLQELNESVNESFEVIAAHNRLHPLSQDQSQTLDDFLKENRLRYISFDLVHDKGDMALRTAENVLQAGRGISGLSPFKAVYFKNAIESLTL
jgi:hypothetical protein